MEKVKVLVVEDETIIAESIISMIEKMGYEYIGTAIRAKEAFDIAKEKKPDIALLDIHLKGEKTGIWLAEQIKNELDIPYIFMTSFSDRQTIEQAVATLPYGYLVKPLKYHDIFAAIVTALAKFAEEKKSPATENSLDNPSSQSHTNSGDKTSLRIKDILFVKDEYQYVKITLTDIDYIKSDGNYVEIHCGDKMKVIKETLKNIEAKLDAFSFFQVHRSYIVNIRKIERIGGNSLLVNRMEIPIIKQKKDELLQLLNVF